MKEVISNNSDHIITALLAISTAIIANNIKNKTSKVIISLVCLLLAVVLIACKIYVAVQKDASEREEENFYIPVLDYEISYDMSRPYLTRFLELKGEDVHKNIVQGNNEIFVNEIAIWKYWNSLKGVLVFGFDEPNEDLSCIYWTINYNELDNENKIVDELDGYYGKRNRKNYNAEGNYYWKAKNCIVTFEIKKFEQNNEVCYVSWYKPDYFRKNKEKEIVSKNTDTK